MDPVLLTVMAQLSAQRRLLIHAYVSGFVDQPDALGAARDLRASFADRPTLAPERGSDLDPVVSDLLAATTDEAIDDFMARVIGRLSHLRKHCEEGELVSSSPDRPAETPSCQRLQD
jgi:hypothetical protein